MPTQFPKVAATVLFLVLSLGVCAQAQQSSEQLAQQSAESWLALVDSSKYADSWQQASSLFKSHVTKDQWQSMVGPVREPLGKNTSRKLVSAKFTKTLPGAPDGQYVVIQFESTFEHKQSAIETITPMLDKDNQWRVSGYLIK